MLLRSRRDLRLASGLVLFTYVALHLTAHSLGLVSLATAEAALRATVLVWHSVAGTALLYGAAAIHVGLALLAIYERRTLRIPPVQALRIVLGLTMPVILIGHFVATRYAFEHFGLAAEYQRVVAGIWAGDGQGRQLALLAPGWLHGCLGLNFAFGSRRWWQRLRFVLFGAALLLPVLAAIGFLTMGRQLADQHAVVDAPTQATAAAQGAVLGAMRDGILATYLGLLGLVVVAQGVRGVNERRRKAVVRITYPGRTVSVPRGWTVLEASRSFHIPHQSTCGGRARCTTCRVRVTEGEAHCPAPGIDEQRTLDRIEADPGVRLACQLRPTGDITVRPLVAVDATWWSAPPPARPTTEREVAVLFVDLRHTDSSAAAGSAHDTIYALDRLNAVVGSAIERAGGVQCRNGGDSWMALFGLDAGTADQACRQALLAALRIEERAAVLTEQLARELGLVGAISIGVHVGPVVAGTIGQGEARRLSAVGNAISDSELLRTFARRRGLRFVVSKALIATAGIADAGLEWQAAEDGPSRTTTPLLCAATSASAMALAPSHSG